MYDGQAVLFKFPPSPVEAPEHEPFHDAAREPGLDLASTPTTSPTEHKRKRYLPITRKRCPGTRYFCEIVVWHGP